MSAFRASSHILLGLTAIGLVMAGTASAAPRVLKPMANGPAPETAKVSDRAPKDTDYLYGNIIDGSHMTVSGASGSLAVGLMFGPLGVAANAMKVKEKNLERARPLDALAHTDVVALLTSVRAPADGVTTEVAADAPAYELMPVVQIRFDSDTAFHVGCLVQASVMKGDKRTWRARYSVEMPGVYDSQSQASIDAAGQTLAPCLSEASRLFDAHARGGMQPGETAQRVVLNGKTVPMFVVEAEYPARLIAPDMAGIAEYPATPVTATAP